jgi:hypothetical protein
MNFFVGHGKEVQKVLPASPLLMGLATDWLDGYVEAQEELDNINFHELNTCFGSHMCPKVS